MLTARDALDEPRHEHPMYKVEYNAEEKQLSVIAADLEAQDELNGLAAILCHTNVCQLNWEYEGDPEKIVLTIGGEIERRSGQPLIIRINSTIIGFMKSFKAFSDYTNIKKNNELIFLWAGEIPVDDWKTLVFCHI